ncbi:MAG: recombinase family protein [Lacrimispora sp.]
MPGRKAAAYCRVSTDKEDQKNSLSAQEEYFRRHTEENGYELVCIYADEGITGTKKKNRKEFLRMLEEAKEHKFDTLFVKDVSRFARNTVDSLESVRMLKDYNVSIVFINNQGILETSSELMFTIMSAMAQEESVNTSKRVKFGKAQNARNGKVPNFVYGYEKVAGEYFRLYINEEESLVVKRIFRLYTEEGEGCLSIANRLNSEGIRTKRGCEWSQNAVSRIIKNEIYIGQVINGKEETREIYSSKRLKKDQEGWFVVHNEELRIVEDEVFYRGQAILNRRRDAFHTGGERQSNRYVFSTLIKCKECGRSFRRIEKKYANTSAKWTCSSRNNGGAAACANASKVDEAVLLREICDYLDQCLGDKAAYMGEAKRQYWKWHSQWMPENRSGEKHRRELQKCQLRLKKLQDMYLNDLISMEDLKEQSTSLKRRAEELEEEMGEEKQRMKAAEEEEKRLEEAFCGKGTLSQMGIITNEMLKQVIDRIEVDREGRVEVIFKKKPEYYKQKSQ